MAAKERTTKFFGQIRSGIIFAADLLDEEACLKICRCIRHHVDVIKLASPLIFKHGMDVARRISDATELPIFLDVKIADVPHTDFQIVELARAAGVSAVMVHGYIGPDGVLACMDAARDELGVIVQGELTHPGGEVFSAAIADDIAIMAQGLGVYGVQAPGNRPSRIRAVRNIVGAEPIIVCCGVGAQGGTFGGVQSAGADYAIIGRAIYNAQDPLRSIEELRGTGW